MERTTEFFLGRLGIEQFVPLIPSQSVRRGVITNREVRLFPGYMFLEFDLRGNSWYSIQNVPGIVKLLPAKSEQPLPLPDGFVLELQGRIASGDFTAVDAVRLVRRYAAGELVVVTSGPFEQFSGRVIRYQKGSLLLLMYLFGRPMEIPIPLNMVTA